MIIKIEALARKAGRRLILDGINADFAPGMNVIIGPNGAGKTTLLRHAALLDRPDSGEIFFDGKPLSRLDSAEKLRLRRRSGFSFQNPPVFNASVAENLAYPLKVRGERADAKKTAAMLGKFGLGGKENENAKTLSGGEKQRLSLARAFITAPSVLLLDEPVANLDPVSAKAAERSIMEEAARGSTVITTTHNIVQARRFGGKIFFMSGGRIKQAAGADEFFSKPAAAEIAEYSFAENVFRGVVSSDVDGKYLETGKGLKISVVTSAPDGAEVAAALRAEDIFVSLAALDSSARNCIKCRVKKTGRMGPVYSLTAETGGVEIETVITKQSLETLGIRPGTEVYLTFKATAVHVIAG